MNDNTLNIALMLGMLVILALALLPLLNVAEPWMRWAFAAAAIVVLAVRVAQAVRLGDCDNLRIRRLYRINIVSALMFCASAVMFWNKGQTEWSTNWVAFLMAGAALMMYVGFAIDHELRRIARGRDNDNKH